MSTDKEVILEQWPLFKGGTRNIWQNAVVESLPFSSLCY